MKILEPHNNALFLAYWRERTRPGPLFSAFLLVSVIILLIFANGLMNESYVYHYGTHMNQSPKKEILAWPKKVMLDLCHLQGVIILLFGSLSVFRRAARERSSHIIDFHRCSPTSRINQVLGMLLGGACLEWILFFFLTIIGLLLITFTYLPFTFFIQFLLAIMICSLFLHSFFSLLALSQNHSTQSKIGLVGFVILLYLSISLFTASKLSFFYHLSWIPAFEQLNIALKGVSGHFSPYYLNQREMLYMSFGHKLNSLFYQSLIQIPFIALFIHAMTRKISSIERPPFTKGQTLLGIFYILFLFSGSALSNIIHAEYLHYYSYSYTKEFTSASFFYLTVSLGILGAFLVTPDRLVYKKGIKRCLKLKIPRLRSGEDPSLNIQWLCAFCFIAFIHYILYACIFRIDFFVIILHLLILFSYPLFFGFLYQFFQLSQFQHKRLIFGTVLLILWIILPLYCNIIKFKTKASLIYILFTAPSPFFGGINSMTHSMTRHSSKPPAELTTYTITLVVLVFSTFLLLYQYQRKLKKSTEKECP